MYTIVSCVVYYWEEQMLCVLYDGICGGEGVYTYVRWCKGYVTVVKEVYYECAFSVRCVNTLLERLCGVKMKCVLVWRVEGCI